jgi:hypothetical protein
MIITLCGSARFEPWFHAWNEALSLSGHCVFGLAAYPSAYAGEKDWYSPQQKRTLDNLHKAKVSHSGAILVLNAFGYVGDSTISEIEWAQMLGKRIHFIESTDGGQVRHVGRMKEAAAKFGLPDIYPSQIDTMKFPVGWNAYELLQDEDALRKMLDRRLGPLKGSK